MSSHHSHSHSQHSTSHPDTTNLTHITQSTPQTTTPDGKTSTVTTTGNIVQSSDPSTNPSASLSHKLMGDVKGAISGTVGSMEAATGAAFRNKNMEEKGFEKMEAEDERLGSKRGVMPVGAERREGVEDAESTEGMGKGKGGVS